MLDDHSFRAADIAESIDVLETTDLADYVKAVVSQSVDDRGEVIDLDGDVPKSQSVRRQGVHTLVVGWRMVLDEFELAAAVRRSHHHYLRLDAVEPVDLVYSLALDQCPASRSNPRARKSAATASRSSTTTPT